MNSFTDKKVNMDNSDYNVKVIKESDTSSNEDDSDNSTNLINNGESNIGLDLLVNSNKMLNAHDSETNKNHKEIDLIKSVDDEEESDNVVNEEKKNDSNNSDDSDDSDSDDDSNDIPKNANYSYTTKEPEPSLDDIIEEKKKLLYEFERFKKRGYHFSKQFSLASSLEEMKYELDKVKKQREIENSIAFSRKMLMAFVTAIEFLNSRFDPFELKLDGWSENVHESVGEYDDIFEELHEKYKSTGKVSPEIKLLLTLGGSAFMFHLTNNIFKSTMPQFESALGNNPNIINDMMNKKSNSPNQSMGGNSNNGGGGGGGLDIGSLLGMMSGMGGGGGMPGMGGGMPGIGGMPGMGGGMPGMDNMGGGMGGDMPDIQEQSPTFKDKSMEGPQGLDTLLDSLSTNKKKTGRKTKKKGLNL